MTAAPATATERPAPAGAGPGVHRSVLVIGGGIAGITAAVEAAEAGYEAIIVEKGTYLGGRVAQLNKYFPKLCPPYCGLEINFQRIRREPRVRVFTLAEVESIAGGPGRFDVAVRLNPRYVNDRCTACNECVPVCPVERPDAFNHGLGTTKTIHLPHAMAFPMKYAIDPATCLFQQCAKCVAACRYDAIDLAMAPRTMALQVGAVVVATGWKPYDAARLDNLGFGRYPNVITNVMMERLAAPNGPTGGKIVRPSDGRPVTTAAFIQCAGSRDVNHLGYCSSICCLASLKEAVFLREQNPQAKAHVFYIDLRTPGTYEFFAQKVLSDPNVQIMKGKVARVTEDPATRDLTVEAEDILSAAKISLTVDLVVLATGMAPSLQDGAPAGIRLDGDGFAVADTEGEGLVAAGCARGPVDVATASQEGTAAALRAIQAIQAAARRA
jgi:quinone-modifying oxidoreductase subunit QmoA